jgi:plastocyanin
VVAGKAPPDAIVTLEPAAPREFPPPANSLLMDQFGLAFLPDSLVGRVGQRIDFRSSEDVQHNVRVVNTATKETVFNVATPPFETYTHTFDTPGDYAVSCDVHPSMRAGIYIAPTPYVTVAGKDGSFSLSDVEPGSYRLVAIHRDQRVERDVEVSRPRTEITIDAR